jgi:hypothetical protein
VQEPESHQAANGAGGRHGWLAGRWQPLPHTAGLHTSFPFPAVGFCLVSSCGPSGANFEPMKWRMGTEKDHKADSGTLLRLKVLASTNKWQHKRAQTARILDL